jgi:hypothetical protein
MADVNQTRVCGYCKTDREWIWNGQKLKDGSKVYLDSHGFRWAGRRCPICEKSRVATAVRHDSFDRDMIFQQLSDRGFTIVSKPHPLIVEKAGETFQVGIRRAKMDNGNIVIESKSDPRDDIVALVFESVRLVTPEQMNSMSVYTPANTILDDKRSTSLGVTTNQLGPVY